MCVILHRCRFLHIPKTGGTWVRNALNTACPNVAKTAYGHGGLQDAPGQGMFTFAFIRHPWSWWRSYWLFKRTLGWDLKNRLDIMCMDNVFERFMTNVADTEEGHCTRLFENFVGCDATDIQFVGRSENLVDHLVVALQRADEPFNEQRLRETAIANAGNYKLFSTRCSAEVRQRILDAEHKIMTRFDYAADD